MDNENNLGIKIFRRLRNLSVCELCVTFLIIYVFFIICVTTSYIDKKTFGRNTYAELEMHMRSEDEKRNQKALLKYTRNPAVIWWTQDLNLYPQTTECGHYTCDVYSGRVLLPTNSQAVYLFYGSRTNFHDLPLPRHREKHIWGLSLAESPMKAPDFVFEEKINLFNFSSTFSRYSDLPFPLHYMLSLENITNTKYYVKTSIKNFLLRELSPIIYLQSDCDTLTERDRYVSELMKYHRIDSYGRCLKNKNLPSHINNYNYIYMDKIDENNFLRFIANYKFMISIENAVCEDYITEKFWRAIHIGVVPIYFGSPTIRDWMPNNKSAILLEDFPTPKLMSDHINKLMKDDDLYEEYLEHKIEGKISNAKLSEEIRARPFQTDDEVKDREFVCYLCKKLHENKGNVSHYVKKHHYNCYYSVTALSPKH